MNREVAVRSRCQTCHVRRLSPAPQRLASASGRWSSPLAAQVMVPVPFSPVPMTLQPLAVLVVGGLLGGGRRLGALRALPRCSACSGLPVFAGGGSGLPHLLGPTGGYLLAFPVAAAVTGALVRPVLERPEAVSPSGLLRVLLACALGMVIIHVGGVAQLALLGGDPAAGVPRRLRSRFLPATSSRSGSPLP